MSNASFYKWQSKYGGIDASMICQIKALEDENRRLKKMYAKMSMQSELLKDGPRCAPFLNNGTLLGYFRDGHPNPH